MPRFPDVYLSAFFPRVKTFGTRVSHFIPCAQRYRVLQPVFFVSFLLQCVSSYSCSHHSSWFTQSATATLSGTVMDQTGAVVSGVNITVISVGRGFQRSTTTNGEGVFVVPFLPPGNYTVKTEHQGFSPTEQNVILNVSNQVVIKLYLKIRDISQTIEVGSSSLIDKSPSMSPLVDRQFVNNLPLNGRIFQSLIALTLGFVLTKTNSETQGQFSINGQWPNANYFMIGGVGANIGLSPAPNVGAATADFPQASQSLAAPTILYPSIPCKSSRFWHQPSCRNLTAHVEPKGRSLLVPVPASFTGPSLSFSQQGARCRRLFSKCDPTAELICNAKLRIVSFELVTCREESYCCRTLAQASMFVESCSSLPEVQGQGDLMS
jgi:hypothetical protein